MTFFYKFNQMYIPCCAENENHDFSQVRDEISDVLCVSFEAPNPQCLLLGSQWVNQHVLRHEISRRQQINRRVQMCMKDHNCQLLL